MADDDIREGSPKKKKAPPPDEDDDDRPRKKRRDEEDEDEDEAPRKKKKVRKDEDEDESDLGSSPLSAIVPVGGSIWALLALYLGLLSCFIPGLWLISLLCGVLAFVTHKHKASYGSMAGNMRAILGIIISLGAMVFHAVILFLWLTGKLK